VSAHQKPKVRFYHWPLWIFLLSLGLIVFYGLFAPAWMLIRLVTWLIERAPRRQRDVLADAP